LIKLSWLKNFSLGLLGAVVFALGVSILTATTAATSFSYRATELGTLGGSSSKAYGMNDAGQVVGIADTSSGFSHAFLWDEGTMKDLGTLDGYSDSQAYKINNARQVVGSAYTGDLSSSSRALLWDKGDKGSVQDLGSLGGSHSEALGINNRGQVVGISSLSGNTFPYRAFLWNQGKMQNLGTLDNSDFSSAMSINDRRQVVGQAGDCAFLWEKDTMKPISTDCSFFASDINNRGQAVGGSLKEAALWTISNGMRKNLGTIGAPYTYLSSAYGINNRGRVVGGTYQEGSRIGFNPYHAFIAVNNTIQDLNSLLPANSGWELTEARDINNYGQIVGYGQHKGQTRAFLLTPTWTIN
jgi:probable HAF family extracellular repeat protein